MTPKEIIVEAWNITRRERKLRAWGFTSELLETLLDMKLLTYQMYFAYSFFFLGDTVGFFAVEEFLLETIPRWGFITFVVTLLTLFVLEVFIPKMCLGAIIGLGAKAHKGEEMRGGLVLALYNFLPLFAVQELFLLGRITTVVTIASLILRYMPEGLHIPLIALGFVFWFLSNIFRFFTVFAEEDIVIRKSGIFAALGRSFKLIISHLGHVFFLLMLLIFISLRVLLNAIVLFVLPAIILAIGMGFAYFFSTTLTVLFSTIAGIVVILFASYFFAYLHVFTQTVWTITYIELQKMKDLDIIDITQGGSSAPEGDGELPSAESPQGEAEFTGT